MFQVCPRIVPEILKLISDRRGGRQKKKVASPYMETVEWLLEM